MPKLIIFFLMLFIFTSCEKDLAFNEIPSKPESRTISSSNTSDSLWASPEWDKLKRIRKDIATKSNANEIGSFLYLNGTIKWSQARMVRKISESNFILSIPTIINNKIASILFVRFSNDQFSYKHFRLDDLKFNTESLINKFGLETTILVVSEFIQHEQKLDDYTHYFLFQHLNAQKVKEKLSTVNPRGWCLIKIELLQPTYLEDNAFTSTATGITFKKDGGNYIPIYQSYDGSTKLKKVTWYREVMYLWVWCEDGVDEIPWTKDIPSGTDNNGPNWDYNSPRWDENNKDCLFAFDDPKATEKINRLEEKLLSMSCGDQSAFNIKDIIDSTIKKLCEEFYKDEASLASDGFDTSNFLNQLESKIKSTSNFTLGEYICDVCNQFSNTYECISAINNCMPGNYIDCVNENLVNFAISIFTKKFDVKLELDEISLIKTTITSYDDNFENSVKELLIKSLDLNLLPTEVQYIKNNFGIFDDLSTILKENTGDNFSKASAEIYTKLATNNLLNLNYNELIALEATLDAIIDGSLSANNLDDRLAISSIAWYSIFKAESEANGGGALAWLRAQVKSVKEGFLTVLKPISEYIDQNFPNLPTTVDEFYVLGSVLSPVLIDLGLDFVPIVGDVKGFADAFSDISKGDLTSGSIGLIASIAGVLPIGDLIKSVPKIKNAVNLGLGAFSCMNLLAKHSASTFKTIKNFIQSGITTFWDDGLKKLIFKNGNEVIGEIAENGVPNIAKTIFRSIVDPSTFKNLTSKSLTNTSSGNSISKTFINDNASKFNVTEANLKSKFDDIVANGDKSNPPGWGKKTEELIKDVIEDGGNSGYRYADGSYNGPIDGVNGFDGVFINDATGEVIINESKQWTSGSVSLNGTGAIDPNTGLPWPSQMTDAWVDAVETKIRIKYPNDADKIATANAIQNARQNGKLTKIVTVVDRTSAGNANGLTGGINIIKVQ